jgi:hypothetical protein
MEISRRTLLRHLGLGLGFLGIQAMAKETKATAGTNNALGQGCVGVE